MKVYIHAGKSNGSTRIRCCEADADWVVSCGATERAIGCALGPLRRNMMRAEGAIALLVATMVSSEITAHGRLPCRFAWRWISSAFSWRRASQPANLPLG